MDEIDAVLERIACEMERGHLLDLAGIAAKRKRDREDAKLRHDTRREQRNELAGWIRSFKSSAGNSHLRFLREVEEGGQMGFAWGPAVAAALSARLVTMTLEIELDTHLANCRHRPRFALTDKGRAALATADPTEEP